MKNVFRPLRSVLYMPASNKRAIEKSLTSLNADAFIYDLEDSVAPESKQIAREHALHTLTSPRNSFSSAKILRINSVQSNFFAEDLHFLNSLTHKSSKSCNLDAVLLAKVESHKDVDKLEQEGSDLFRSDLGSNLDIWCMIETPKGVMNISEILSASNRVKTVVLGLEDLCNELRCKSRAAGRFNLMFAIQHVLLAARAQDSKDINVIDGVYTDLNDDEGFEAECIQGLELGMSGKSLIHPKTIDTANKLFSPSPEEITKAAEMIQCYEEATNKGEGVAVYKGSLVEELHVRRARKIVEVAKFLDLL